MSTPANPDLYAWRWADDAADVNTPDFTLDGGTTTLNTTYEVQQSEFDTTIYLYVGIENDGEKTADAAFTIQANIDAAGPFTVTTTSNGVRVAAGAEADGTAITASQVGTGAGSFANGEYDDVDGQCDADLAAASYTNYCFAITFRSADLSGGESIDFTVQYGGADVTNDSGATINVSTEAAAASAISGIATPTFASESAAQLIGPVAAVSTLTFGGEPDFYGILGQVETFRFIGSSATLTAAAVDSGAIAGTSSLTFANQSTAYADAYQTATAALTFANQSDIDAIGVITGVSTPTFSNQSVAQGIGTLAGSSALSFAGQSDIDAIAVATGASALTFANQSTILGLGATPIEGVSSLTFTGQSDIDAIGVMTAISAVSFANESAITSVGVLTAESTITFATESDIDAVGSLAGVAAPTFANQSTLTAQAYLYGVSLPTFANQSSLGSVGFNDITGVAALTFSNESDIDAEAYFVENIQIVFSNQSSLIGLGSLAGVATVSFSNQSDIDAVGNLTAAAALAFANESVGRLIGPVAGVATQTFANQSDLTSSQTGALSGVASASFTNQSTPYADAYITGTSAKVFQLTATPLGAELAEAYPKPAGRGRGRKRYVVEIDGQEFVLDSVKAVRELMQSAEELAAKKAPMDLLVVSKKIKRKREVPKVLIDDFPTPRLSANDAEVRGIIRETQDAINQIYLNAARDAEIRELLRRKMREQDEEEAIS